MFKICSAQIDQKHNEFSTSKLDVIVTSSLSFFNFFFIKNSKQQQKHGKIYKN